MATAASGVGSFPIAAGGATDPNYDITFVAGTLTVTPAPLTITADNQTVIAGSALPILTAQFAGLVNGDTATTIGASLSTTAEASSPAGNYPITVSAANRNYTITVVPGSLTVTPAPQKPIALTAPKTVRARGLVASLRGLSLANAPATALVSVRVSTNVGKLKLTLKSLKINGSNTGRLTFSGSQAMVNRALNAISLAFTKAHSKAKVTVSATSGGLTKVATIAVS